MRWLKRKKETAIVINGTDFRIFLAVIYGEFAGCILPVLICLLIILIEEGGVKC